MTDPTLYRMFDASGVLLYVGKTINPPQRLRDHNREKDWFFEVADIRLERFATEADVLVAEESAIKREGPVHNIVHNRQTNSRSGSSSANYSYTKAPLSFAESIIASDIWQPTDRLPFLVAEAWKPDRSINFIRPHGSTDLLKSITHFKTLASAVQFALGYSQDQKRASKASGWFPESDVWVIDSDQNRFLTVVGESEAQTS